ncbi:lysine N(6)-hydroxylase/L-ornithine N(5)-oxygenase family protein [Streptomyces gilvosporeus]|uniref:L-lysine N6-monooxygenase MbtG n=1 Tax=Streptomyces gilvosporeus TaxID=553510 RepID=A0A1V0TNG6_9ACTN|nr:SidA/IucD/PvdA family monooxygenase [Streptomyces gilvosporeus]ARF54338.1 L-lysine 6-monooxygenase [Streptomyces gilvosporeus]
MESLHRAHPPERGTAGPHYGCVGVGVGPANLSLASLLHGDPGLTSLFVEQSEDFGWHDGQQIPGASLQVSLFKDLVTLADPTNKFSFLSYLHEQGKIYHYINAQFDAVPRREFRNYLAWASKKNENVVFGEKVLSVDFDGVFVLRTSRRTLTADHVVIGVGNRPWVPPLAHPLLGETQFHVSDFLRRAKGLAGLRVAVVGGGQSGAEAFLDVISRPDGERPRQVSWISRRANFFPIDDTPFTNDYYMPNFSDHFFALDRTSREAFLTDQVLTSDGISADTLRAVYQRCYAHRFIDGNQELTGLHPGRAVSQVVRGADGAGWDLTLVPADRSGPAERITADVIVWATGFRPAPLDMLAPLKDRLAWEDGELSIDQDFAVRWDGPPRHHLFVQNGARRQRGLADPNLSLVAWRSRRIADRMLGVKTDDPYASFVTWPPTADPAVEGFAEEFTGPADELRDALDELTDDQLQQGV